MTSTTVIMRRLRLASPSAALSATLDGYAFVDNGRTVYPSLILDFTKRFAAQRPLDPTDYPVGSDGEAASLILDFENGFSAQRDLNGRDYKIGTEEPSLFLDFENRVGGQK